MNILIVSATVLEVKPLLDFLEIKVPTIGINQSKKTLNNHDIKVLITGVGMVNTALLMGKHMNSTIDLAMNAGVCGAFNKNRSLGEVLLVTKDIISEMGAENDSDFLTFEQLKLPGQTKFELNNLPKCLVNSKLQTAAGITVNTVHGNNDTINKVLNLFSPDVESMEGAAFFAGCIDFEADYIQIRAISNYVEKRDKSKWNLPLAIQNLNNELIQLITQL
ncbi:MAG: futalosine hydrolase [Bacteroidetes bacterium]|jgi:futalosine hydrolase|nr:futalosine hydrolase [Bacteroidota bacterium]MCA6444470.1 futalosine hydrolase [Bacteroidota bacterium]